VEGEPPYQYVGGNVVNLIDPSGMTPPKNDCDACPPKSKLDNGYSESAVAGYSVLRPIILEGTEIVYDFATLEIAEFSVHTDWDIPPFPIDIGILSYDKIWDASIISGFEPEPKGNLAEEYVPHVVNATFGGSAGVILNVQFGAHIWWADDFSLMGTGYWYGAEAALLNALYEVTPEFTYHKAYTELRYQNDLGSICNPDDARKFLNVLQTWPYPWPQGISYSGLVYWRYLVAVPKFKEYAGLD
jgi:hypothetical protein